MVNRLLSTDEGQVHLCIMIVDCYVIHFQTALLPFNNIIRISLKFIFQMKFK